MEPIIPNYDEPILFLIFNRLDVTKEVFAVIKKIRPTKLYVAADGYRLNKTGEDIKCEQVRNYVLDNVDWNCEVQTLFRKENLGCKLAVSSAIDWFFSCENRGVILEDDCLPSLSFFQFCKDMLVKYEDQPQVMSISGYNALEDTTAYYNESYHFSKFFHCWGWASWRRAWEGYHSGMPEWPNFKKKIGVGSIQKGLLFKDFWNNIFDDVYNGKIDTWDYQMNFHIWNKSGLCCTPSKNLVTNVGFGADATHTKENNVALRQRFEFTFPLIHPTHPLSNQYVDELETKHEIIISYKMVLLRKLRRNNFLKAIAKKLLPKRFVMRLIKN